MSQGMPLPSAGISSEGVGDGPTSFAKLFDLGHGLVLLAVLGYATAKSMHADGGIPVALLIVNGAFSIYGQITALQKQRLMRYISFFFSFTFMSVAPLLQIGAEFDPIYTNQSVLLYASICALGFTLIGLAIDRGEGAPVNAATFRPAVVSFLGYALLALVCAVAILFIYDQIGSRLFTSRDDFDDFVEDNFDSVVGKVLTGLVMPTSLYGALIGLDMARRNRMFVTTSLFSALLATAAIVNNFFILPRFRIAAFIIFAFHYLTRATLSRGCAAFLIFGVFLAPFFNSFRTGDNIESFRYEHFEDIFLFMDYDAFSLMCYIIEYTKDEDFVYGQNILGALLFFVPRSIWEDKPLHTAAQIMGTLESYREAPSNNLSSPLVAEGYYSFGFIGAALISLLYWHLLSRVELRALRHRDTLQFLNTCVAAGVLLLLLRGALLSAVAYLCGCVIAATVSWSILKIGANRTPGSQWRPEATPPPP
jgi:hypothetical protein